MRERWKNFNTLNKTGIILLISSVLVMILGLILVAISKDASHANGFSVIQDENWKIGKLIMGSPTGAYSNATILKLQSGIIIDMIITPILFATTAIIFGYNYLWKNKELNKK